MDALLSLSSVKFKNQFELKLKNDSIVLVVGPNNAGKSLFLKELYQKLFQKSDFDFHLLDKIETIKTGTIEEALLTLSNRKKGDLYHFTHTGGISTFYTRDVESSWKNEINLEVLASYFVKEIGTSERLNIVMPASNINFIDDMSTHPIQYLKEDSDKEIEFSKYFKQAFNMDLIVNHGAGSIIPLHVGERPLATLEKHPASTAYQNELRKLGQLHEQGDGMKSFVGVLLSLFVENYSISIIDEPEAFLHPPQSKLLGQMIARNLRKEKQIFIATHSEHFLKGLLDYAGDRLIILRIQRNGRTNEFSLLENAELKDIWNDSLLRHSNILDGLFHSKVVVCESDSDCRFFSAILYAVVDELDLPSPDILFVQSGGKHRFPVVIKALKKLNVPLVVIGDFDLYNNEHPIKPMYEGMGGQWADVKTNFKIVKQAIDQRKPELNTAKVKEKITELLQEISEEVVPEEKAEEIKKLLKKSSTWTEAKSSGKSLLPAGDATKSFNEIQAKFEEMGIVILEIGEIEAFDKTVGNHGPKWVNEVLEKDITSNPDLIKAKEFVKTKILKINS